MNTAIAAISGRIENGPASAGNTMRSLTQAIELTDWRATVNGTRTITTAEQIARFWSKVDRSGGPQCCWHWTAAVNATTGYGIFHPSRRGSGFVHTVTAHRFAAHLAGLIDISDPQIHVDHVCHNDAGCPAGRCSHRKCCNPAHFRAVTNAENVNASHNSNVRKTHCPSGHEYTPENVRIQRKTNTTSRKCIACERARGAARARKEVA